MVFKNKNKTYSTSFCDTLILGGRNFGLFFFFFLLLINSVATKQHEWTVATEPLCCNCPMERSCRARWASLAQPYNGQPLSQHHAHCSDRRQQFLVETENSLSQSRLLHPWPSCVMTSTTIATQGQPSPVATEKNSVATQAIRFAHGPCCDTDGHVAT